MSTLLCVGLGYSARELAKRLLDQGWTVEGTTRSGNRHRSLPDVLVHRFDGSRSEPAVADAIRRATHLLISAPPGEGGDPLLRHHANDIGTAPALTWIGYLSTVGVYGDHRGGWIDETMPATPGSPRSRERLQAENDWLAVGPRAGRRVEIFRISGIYGPGRSAIDTMRAGTARRIIKPGQVFNRIHVADIATVLEAAIARATGHTVFNLADDEPSPPQDVVAYAAELLGLPVPEDIPFAQANLSPMGRSFYEECKRVSNARIKSALGVRLAYPTYREGLRAILQDSP